MTTSSLVLGISLTLSLAAAAGCGRPESLPEGTTDDQVASGTALFAANCASCHGAAGMGTFKAPPLVGPRALPLNPPPGARIRTRPFHTAKDVLDFIRVNMPLNRPGSLSPAEYDAILAFALEANGVNLHGVHVNEESAPQFVLH
jgi:mono/diheme cytochrome c family protein